MDPQTNHNDPLVTGPVLLKTVEVMRLLRVSRNTLFRYIDQGLPVHRLSARALRFDAAEVEAWVRGKTGNAA